MKTVSKSQLKPKLLEYLRTVEEEKDALIITHQGKPVLKVSPFQPEPEVVLKSLKNSVLDYVDPAKAVGESDWELVN